MYISRFQIGNYKSFRDPGPLELTQGFNIISGQNNSGKTALLEAVGLNFVGNPHRSIKTVPARDTTPDQVSRAEVSFTLPPEELKELMLASPGQYLVARPVVGSPFALKIGYVDDSNQSGEKLLQAIFSQELLTFRLRFEMSAAQGGSLRIPEVPSYGLYPAQKVGDNWNYLVFQAAGNSSGQRAGPPKVPMTLAYSWRALSGGMCTGSQLSG